MAEANASNGARPRVASDFPYRSPLLASLSALILLWESPTRAERDPRQERRDA